MTVCRLVEKYIENARKAFEQIKLGHSLPDERAVGKVLDSAERYYRDSIYFARQNEFETALCSIAYCEGLLDALRLLELVEFRWSARSQEE
jgi:FAD synthetase